MTMSFRAVSEVQNDKSKEKGRDGERRREGSLQDWGLGMRVKGEVLRLRLSYGYGLRA